MAREDWYRVLEYGKEGMNKDFVWYGTSDGSGEMEQMEVWYDKEKNWPENRMVA